MLAIAKQISGDIDGNIYRFRCDNYTNHTSEQLRIPIATDFQECFS